MLSANQTRSLGLDEDDDKIIMRRRRMIRMRKEAEED